MANRLPFRLALALSLIAMAACRGAATNVDAPDEPLVTGPVETIRHHATGSGLLVRAAPGSREMCGIAATADGETRYLRRDADGATRSATLGEIEVGDTVEVHVDGPVAESCPVQGRASLIVLLGAH